MYFKKKHRLKVEYDPGVQIPVIKASICNGERVAGFKNKEDGQFTEVMYIASDEDLRRFKEACGITDIRTEY